MEVDSPHPQEGSNVGRRRVNRDTLLPGMIAPFGGAPCVQIAPPATRAEMHAAYARVRDAHEPMSEPGYRLYAVSGMLLQRVDVPLRDDAYAIVGRHTQCDLHVDGDPCLGLRHMVVRTVRLADGSLALRVLDLHTSLGFFLEGDQRMRSIFASGPITFRAGAYVFVAIPSDVELTDEPPKSILEQADAPPPSIAAGAPYRAPAMRRSGGYSRITLLPAPPMLEALPPAAAGHRAITLVRGEQRQTMQLTDAQLDLGVLLGRADKCVDAGLRQVLSECISRVHLLLLRDGGAYYAFDAGSTNGTLHDGKEARRVRLPDTGTVLTLSRHYPVHMFWHAAKP